jgi:hypothetical protein
MRSASRTSALHRVTRLNGTTARLCVLVGYHFLPSIGASTWYAATARLWQFCFCCGLKALQMIKIRDYELSLELRFGIIFEVGYRYLWSLNSVPMIDDR